MTAINDAVIIYMDVVPASVEFLISSGLDGTDR